MRKKRKEPARRADGSSGFMLRALGLARKAREKTWPNPMVGAVVVSNGRILGEGYHKRAGLAHAEVVALDQAGGRARGADLYVTLEPCHCTGCTGPCTERIKRAGIRRVFVGTLDPNPREQGRGVAELKRAGVEVAAGYLEEDCCRLNEVYNVFIKGKRPFVLVKAASSLDGRIAVQSGDSRWISGKAARTYAHRLRSRASAVMVGAGTAIKDDPSLDVRHVKGTNPAVAVLDSRLSLTPRARMFRLHRGAPVRIYTSRNAPARRAEQLRAAGARIIRVPSRAGLLSLDAVMKDLHSRGTFRLLVEGGSTLIGQLLEQRMVDRMDVMVTSWLLGSKGIPLAGFDGPAKVAGAPRLDPVEWKRIDQDMCCSGTVRWPAGRG